MADDREWLVLFRPGKYPLRRGPYRTTDETCAAILEAMQTNQPDCYPLVLSPDPAGDPCPVDAREYLELNHEPTRRAMLKAARADV